MKHPTVWLGWGWEGSGDLPDISLKKKNLFFSRGCNIYYCLFSRHVHGLLFYMFSMEAYCIMLMYMISYPMTSKRSVWFE